MKITTKSNFSVFELIIETDNTTIKEDVAGFNNNISQDLIDDFISASLEMHRFTGKSDGEFVKHILNKYVDESVLNDITQ